METRNDSRIYEQNHDAGVLLSAADLETLARLMLELKDLTLSRSTFLAASDFLSRCGHDGGADALVRPERLEN